MKFKTEMHVHSKCVSDCSSAEPEYLVERYLSEGYTTVVLTNHLSKFTYKKLAPMTWDEKREFFIKGYTNLKAAAGDKLNILFGMELRFDADDNDYLVYGMTEEFLRSVDTDLMQMDLLTFSELAHQHNMLVYQAHPFRNGMNVRKPKTLDGIEIYNGNLKIDSRNDIAEAWAKKYDLNVVAGSDFHNPVQKVGAGILTNEPITSNEQLLEVLRTRNYEILRHFDDPMYN